MWQLERILEYSTLCTLLCSMLLFPNHFFLFPNSLMWSLPYLVPSPCLPSPSHTSISLPFPFSHPPPLSSPTLPPDQLRRLVEAGTTIWRGQQPCWKWHLFSTPCRRQWLRWILIGKISNIVVEQSWRPHPWLWVELALGHTPWLWVELPLLRPHPWWWV